MSDDVVKRAKAALEGVGLWSVFGEWVAELVNQCTCGGGINGYGHESGCGYEPVGKAERPVAEFAASASTLMPELVAEIERLQPVRVTTVEELDALPAETLIEHDGEVFRNRAFCRTWQEVSGKRYDHDAENVLPAVVVWTPERAR